MRLRELLVIVVAGFLLVFITPTFNKESRALERQAQEASPSELLEEEHTFRIVYRVPSSKEESIADIIWMKKAAEVATSEGVPYFNVLEQKVTKRYVKKYDTELSIIEGIIQLDPDPMRGEFDAREITSLVLTDAGY